VGDTSWSPQVEGLLHPSQELWMALEDHKEAATDKWH
jgi:hypothetical protein